MYGHIATATGWTFSEISLLTLWDVGDLFAYWRDHPPAHVLVAAYMLGTGQNRPANRAARVGNTRSQFHELEQTVIAAGGTVRKRLPEIYRSNRAPG